MAKYNTGLIQYRLEEGLNNLYARLNAGDEGIRFLGDEVKRVNSRVDSYGNEMGNLWGLVGYLGRQIAENNGRINEEFRVNFGQLIEYVNASLEEAKRDGREYTDEALRRSAEGLLSLIGGNLDSVRARLDSANRVLIAHSEGIIDLVHARDSQGISISAAEANIAAQGAYTTSLNARVESSETRQTALEARAGDVEAQTATNAASIAGLDMQAASLEIGQTNLQDRVTAAEGEIANGKRDSGKLKKTLIAATVVGGMALAGIAGYLGYNKTSQEPVYSAASSKPGSRNSQKWDSIFYVSGQGMRKARYSLTEGPFESPKLVDLGAKFPVKGYDPETEQSTFDYEIELVGQKSQKDFDMARRRISTNDYFIEVDWSNVQISKNPEYHTNGRPKAAVYIEGKILKVHEIEGFVSLSDYRQQNVVLRIPGQQNHLDKEEK